MQMVMESEMSPESLVNARFKSLEGDGVMEGDA